MSCTILHSDVVPLYDVADVSWNRSVCTDPMLLHLSYQVSFREETWWCCTPFHNGGCFDIDDITNLVHRDFFVGMTLMWHDLQEAWFQ